MADMSLPLTRRKALRILQSWSWVLLLLLWSAGPSWAGHLPQPSLNAPYLVTVDRVIDGDTVVAITPCGTRHIRLARIDAPEKTQPWGEHATRLLSLLLPHGQPVTVHLLATHAQGRDVADLTLPDGRNVNNLLVQEGAAWWYGTFAPTDPVLPGLEEEARTAGRGLWSQGGHIPPWDWRRGVRVPEDPADVQP